MPISFEPSQPNPTIPSNLLEIVQTAVPAIKHHTLGSNPSFPGDCQHRTEVVVLDGPIHTLLVEAIVQGNVTVALRPQQGKEVDALHHPSMLTRPMPSDQFHLLGIPLVERRVIDL
jgi:hypothetical protein